MTEVKLDFGCGTRKRADGVWYGVDSINFEGVDLVTDLSKSSWEFTVNNKEFPLEVLENGILKDSTVDEAHSSHFLEHLTGLQRISFFNELYRVLKINAKVTIVCPHWSHERAYGDPTHQWPPITSWTYFYLNKGWRDVNAPHVGYNCDFDFSIVGTHDPNDQWVAYRNMETKTVLMSRNINVTTDIVCTLTKRGPQ